MSGAGKPFAKRFALREQVRTAMRPGSSGKECAGRRSPMKSAGTVSVPWCSAWKKLCWLLVPGPPHTPARSFAAHGLAVLAHRLAEAFHDQLLQVDGSSSRRSS